MIDKISTVQEAKHGRQVIDSILSSPRPKQMPETVLEVLAEWGSTWMCESLLLIGDCHWQKESVAAGTSVAVTDGSYIKEYYPNISSAACIIECTEGRGRIVRSFPKQTITACAYRDELLGLLVIHFIQLPPNRVNSTLAGSERVISD